MPGTYVFRPIQANLTHDTEWLGKMDPYCSYRTGLTRVKGPVCRNGGKFPKWDDATVQVPYTNEPSIVVDLMDKDKILFDDNIGSFVIDLHEIQSMGQVSKWYPVYYKKRPAGEILMEAAFRPEFVQQHIQQIPVQETVVVKKVVEEPIIVKEVVREQVPVQTVHKEFQSGTIINGISEIHHGGQGYGLVPKHGPILHQGEHFHAHETHFPDEFHAQPGSYLPQGGLTQGLTHGTHQGGLVQDLTHGTHQGGLTHGTHQGGLIQNLTHGTHQGGLNQGNQGSF